MSTKIGSNCTVRSGGRNLGMCVDLALGVEVHTFDEEVARRIHHELGMAIEHAWPLGWRPIYAGPLIGEQGVSGKWNAICVTTSWTLTSWDGYEAYGGLASDLASAKAACEDVVRRRALGEEIQRPTQPAEVEWE